MATLILSGCFFFCSLLYLTKLFCNSIPHNKALVGDLNVIKKASPIFFTTLPEYVLNIGIDTIELSGTSYHPNIIENLSNLKDKINFQIHNYFPPHKDPFVLNIASEDEEISKLTLDHINYALESCQKLNSNYFPSKKSKYCCI